MFHDVSRATTTELRFEILACFPQTSDVSEPQMAGLDVYRHLTDVVLHVWIVNLVLRRDVVERVVVCGFGRAEESGGVVWNESCLPAFFQILSRVADQVVVWNESATKVDQVAGGRAHSDRIPP